MADLIEGVLIKELVTHTDQRGFLREVIRKTDGFFGEGFGQWVHTIMHVGVTKAWHIHTKQVDWWYVMSGVIEVALCDLRPDSSTYKDFNKFLMGDNQPPMVLKIPPGVAHGCKALTEVNMSYITSRVYDKDDEGRLPHDDPNIGYDWLKGPDIQ